MHPSYIPGKTYNAYGTRWATNNPPLIEIEAIRNGGRWRSKSTGEYNGLGLFHHFKSLMHLCWPWVVRGWSRWDDLTLQEYCNNKITGVMGPANSAKSHGAARFLLASYFCWPNELTGLVSSTDSRSLELRIWGEIKKLWVSAKERHDWIPGHLIESKQMILTDSVDAEARDFRNGIVGVPCVTNGTFIGLGKFVGVKNAHVFLVADECAFMPKSFVDAISNLNKNRGFKCIGLGNPKDPTDALGIICEPTTEAGGWEGADQEEKTKCWDTRYAGGRCVNLVGTDSPNFDYPDDELVHFPHLISRNQIAEDMAFYGRDSLQFSMMNVGMMPKTGVSRRVITRQMCLKFQAMEDPVWIGDKLTRIGYLDAAYGSVGGDRCVFGELIFGTNKDGKLIMAMVGGPVIVPVSIKKNEMPEDQIVEYVKFECRERNIPPENLFFDGTGRASLASAFARLWSPEVVPVEFGGAPSERPVSRDTKRTCREHYAKFVTELWFSVRYIIEAGQFRGMTSEVMDEGCMREWKINRSNRIEIETKAETKKRMGRSPDLFDGLVVGVEGARRRGFWIERFGTEEMKIEANTWLRQIGEKYQTRLRSRELKIAA